MDAHRSAVRGWSVLTAVLLLVALLAQSGCEPAGRTTDNPFIGPSAGRGR